MTPQRREGPIETVGGASKDVSTSDAQRAAGSLRRKPLFAEVGARHLVELLGSATRVSMPTGGTLFEQGEAPDALYVLVRGSVRCWIRDEGADEQLLRVLHAPSAFGGRSCLLNLARSYRAEAEPGAVLLELDRVHLVGRLAESVSFRRAILRGQVDEAEVSQLVGAHERGHVHLVQLLHTDDGLVRSATLLLADAAHRLFGEETLVIEPARTRGAVAAVVERSGAADRAEVNRNPARVLGTLKWGALVAAYDYIFVDPTGLDEGERAAWRAHLDLALTLGDRPGAAPRPPLAEGARHYHAVLMPPLPVGWGGAVALPPQACRLPTTAHALRTAAGDLDALRDRDRAAVERWVRGFTDRTVGVALGGGGAWGYSHAVLLEELHRLGVPVDIVSGSSFGAVVGAYYARYGVEGMQRVVADGRRIDRATKFAMFSSFALERAFADLVPGRLEDLDTVFLPVATDVDRSRVVAFREATIALGVRASGSFPGVFAATLAKDPVLGSTTRFVDGGIASNVPDGPAFEEGADFVIASNCVPGPPTVESRDTRGRLERLWRESGPLRFIDAFRSVFILMHSASSNDASAADALFELREVHHLPSDIAHADAIVAEVRPEVEPEAARIARRWAEFAHRRR